MRNRFSANLSLLWQELEPIDRFGAAAATGFEHVEYQYPHTFESARLKRALRAARVRLVMFNLAPGDLGVGERGLLCLPGREAEFDASVRDGLALARELGVRHVNVPAGIPPLGVASDVVRRVAIGNLRRAAAAAASQGIVLTVEALNPVDRPGYLLTRTAEAAQLVRLVGLPGVRLQFDIYHASFELDPLRSLRRVLPLVQHVQLADHPGRHQPGTGTAPIRSAIDLLAAAGYTGFIGLEYVPIGPTLESFSWMTSLAGS